MVIYIHPMREILQRNTTRRRSCKAVRCKYYVNPTILLVLFSISSHPEVYVLVLPAMGVTSDVLSAFARKPIFGYRAMAYSMIAIAFLSWVVWGHHMNMTDHISRKVDDEDTFTALAFKIVTDPFVGKLTYFRIYSGTLAAGKGTLRPGPGTRLARAERVLGGALPR